MLGRKKPLQAGAEASGVVLEAVYHVAGEFGLGGVDGKSHQANKFSVRVRVTFDDASTAEFSQDLKRSDVGTLYTGDIVPVRYEPTDRSRLEIDVPALAARKREWKADIAETKARLDSGGESSNPKVELIRLSIVQAKRKGDAAEVQRLTALLADLEG